MKTKIQWHIIVLILASLATACTPKTKYDRMVKRELASGVRFDTLFMGLYLEMPEKEFYTHCWLLNSKGLIRQGTRNMSVEYQIKKELTYPATMEFYPTFQKGKIFEMPVRYIYNGWAPWNKKLSSDSLQVDILKWYEKQYGKGFIEVKHPTRGSAFVLVNGNRQISLFKENEMYVWAVFTDLSEKKEVPDSTTKALNVPINIMKDLK